jgi:pyruvate-formate lyase-activating enzyme
MSELIQSIRNLFKPAKPIQPGIYHFQAPPDDPRNYRLHLRVEADGRGVLIINAATVLHLNHTAAEYAYYLIRNLSADQVVQEMAGRYNVDPMEVRKHYQDFTDRIMTLINTPDLDPVTFLDFERHEPFSGAISAPYRLDCALTYRLPGEVQEGAAPVERVTKELSTQEWNAILDKAYQVGIPHVVFTGGEPTLRDDLPALIQHAEDLGMVSGLLSDGLRLADGDYLNQLLQTGLDHLMMMLEPDDERAWTALENALAADLFVALHLTLGPENQAEIPELLKRLAEKGVHAISLTTSDPALQDDLHKNRERVADLGMELVWNLPVPYSRYNPVSLEVQEENGAQGAGKAWLYVEPDGDVLPAQGIKTAGGQPAVLGNFLTDPWEKIWNK